MHLGDGQVPDAEKRALATIVIDTGTSVEQTQAAVAEYVSSRRRYVWWQRQLPSLGGALLAGAVIVGAVAYVLRRRTRL